MATWTEGFDTAVQVREKLARLAAKAWSRGDERLAERLTEALLDIGKDPAKEEQGAR
jgi:hypothetical protein